MMNFRHLFLIAFLLSATALLPELLFAQLDRTYCIPDGMRAYYSFENTFGNRSGSAPDIRNTTSQPTLTTSIAYAGNYSADLDGVDDQLRYNNNLFLNESLQSMTVMLWVNPDSLAGRQTLFEEGGTETGITIRLNADTLQAAVRESSSQVSIAHQNPVLENIWQHVALVYKNGEIRLYLEGIPDSDPVDDTGFGALDAHSNNGGFGATFSGDAFGSDFGTEQGHFFNGQLDEIAYYSGKNDDDAALDESVIQQVITCSYDIQFACQGEIYVAQNNPTDLKLVNLSTSPFTFTDIDTDATVEYNAAGYNAVDSLTYAFVRSTNDKTIVRIAGDGTLTDLGPVPSIEGTDLFTGDVSPEGLFYVMKVNTTSDILNTIDLSEVPYAASQVVLDVNIEVSDVGYNPQDNLLYGIGNNSANLIVVHPETGVVQSVETDPALPSGEYGAVWFTNQNQFFAYRNSPGEIYRIDLNATPPKATLVSSAPVVSRNDGFSCPGIPVVADIGITKSFADGVPPASITPGDTFAYHIEVTNFGPGLASNVTIEDALPEGLLFVDARVDSLNGIEILPDRFDLVVPDSLTNGRIDLTLFNQAVGPVHTARLVITTVVALEAPITISNVARVVGVDQIDGNTDNDQSTAEVTTVSNESMPEVASNYHLTPPYPNPFTYQANFTLTLRQSQHVRISVYDMLGRHIALLEDNVLPARTVHSFTLDGDALSNGMYIIKTRGEHFQASELIVLQR